ncbi:hypothetical protein CHS0354_040364 [Potamilus streckersoni]|uniref:Fibronectin type-III domain-containing protein n=1 Tax=Potamilus streckersoni TaxID=2493646 RepID=A0AAE0S1B4_9BIVA|nr:hypothetical protein CHS0354_040364 [Potamilus streckersoni]
MTFFPDATECPQNLSLRWICDVTSSSVVSFQIFYEPLDEADHVRYTVSHEIDGNTRHFTIRRLAPFQHYRLYMVTIALGGIINKSEELEFNTNNTDTLDYLGYRREGIYPEEVVIILLVVAMWVVAMVLFFKQWDSIRIIQPQEHRFKHVPKNLETIRVVKKPSDSVIYKNYNRKMSLTMVEREKRRLLRMNTVPVMSNVHTLPVIEMEEIQSIERSESGT